MADLPQRAPRVQKRRGGRTSRLDRVVAPQIRRTNIDVDTSALVRHRAHAHLRHRVAQINPDVAANRPREAVAGDRTERAKLVVGLRLLFRSALLQTSMLLPALQARVRCSLLALLLFASG